LDEVIVSGSKSNAPMILSSAASRSELRAESMKSGDEKRIVAASQQDRPKNARLHLLLLGSDTTYQT